MPVLFNTVLACSKCLRSVQAFWNCQAENPAGRILFISDFCKLLQGFAGIALAGTEVKSLRMGKCSVKESFVRIQNGEVYIYGMNISPYEKGNIFNKDPLRIRKLLLHRSEINKMEAKLKEKGLTLVPIKVYFKDSLVKVEIGMARGKKLYDKRQDIAKKDQRREAERDFKVKNLY